MKKRFARLAATLLAGIMTIGLIQPAFPLVAKAAEEEATNENVVTFTADQLTADWGNCDYTQTEAGWELDFGGKGQYAEVKLRLPEEVDMDNCEAVKVKVKDQVGAIALKVWSDESPSEAAAVQYGFAAGADEHTWETAVAGKIQIIGIAENNNVNPVPEGSKVTIESVSFVMKPAEPVEVTYTADQLNADWGNCDYNLTEAGWELNFGGKDQYAQVKLRLPEAVNMANCEEVRFKVKDQVGAITLKLWSDSDSGQEKDVVYGKEGSDEYVWVPAYGETVDLIGIAECNNASPVPEGSKVTLESVTFVMAPGGAEEPDVPVEAEYEWTAEELEILAIKNAPEEVTVAEDNDYAWTFNKSWSEVVLKLPEVINGKKCKNVIFTMKDVEGGNLSFKVYGDSTELKGWYDKPASTEYSFTPGVAKEIDAIGIMAHQRTPEITAEDPVKATLVSVKFIMDTTPDKPIEVEKDIPDLYKEIQKGLGEGARMGTCLSPNHFDDEYLMELVKKHYNAITLENQLKPDAILGKGNTQLVDNEEFGIQVPTLSFDAAEGMLDKILELNKEEGHIDQFKVRGHVLLWYQQTPKWFFCEDYDDSKPQVTKEVMDKRLHWYIKSVLTHFFNEESPYKDLFYSWDVVNEAIMDSGADRTNDGNWHDIYKSHEYINNAFKYAHMYAPESVDLYYNDFNDEVASKAEGIVKLVNEINADGQKVDAIGLQGHYTMASPDAKKFETAMNIYAKAGLTIELTELDMKVSKDFDGSAAMLEQEYTRQAWRYKQLYDVMVKAHNNGVDFDGITFWGIRDCDSWLQDSNWVNGGSDGKQKHYPLLFHDDYTAKLAYWAFVDPSKLDPFIQTADIIENTVAENPMDVMDSYGFTFGNNTEASFVPVWDSKENNIKFFMNVMDDTKDDTDSVTVYLNDEVMEAKRSEFGTDIEGGYSVTVGLGKDVKAHDKVSFDIKVVNGDKVDFFNDIKATEKPDAKFMATGYVKPYAAIQAGTVKIGGEAPDAKWDDVDKLQISFALEAPAITNAYAKLLWDNEYLYVLAEVEDPEIYTATGADHEKDSFEIFVDEDNSKGAYDAGIDQQYRINAANELTFGQATKREEAITSNVIKTEKGYMVEAAIKWTGIEPKDGTKIGVDVKFNDAAEGEKRIGTLSWYDETDMGWSGTNVFGTATLVGVPEVAPSEDIFADLSEEDGWKYEYAVKANEIGFMKGTLDSENNLVFKADDLLKREQLATMLHRIAGEPVAEYTDKFSDVKDDGQYYVNGVMWAAENGVVEGMPGGIYGVGKDITREQLAVMLYRYAKACGVDVTTDVTLADYPDAADVHDWAEDAMAWAVAHKIVNGKLSANGNRLAPLDNATRAECAKMVVVFMENCLGNN